jgi:hypothetical protein
VTRARVFAFGSVLVLIASAAASCRPELGDRDSHITRTSILAVRGEPAEAAEGDAVTYTLLVATPNGPIDAPIASWAYCATPKLLTENGVASAQCLGPGGIAPVADGPSSISSPIPGNACALFGPEVTSADLRPRDPDITGGFYQPLRVTVFGQDATPVAFGLQRVSCKLANASADIATQFSKQYVANNNPELMPIVGMRLEDGAPVSLDAIERGAKITLRASWPEASAESYVVFDLPSRSLVHHREEMRVSWFVSDGVVDNDRTGRAEDELETFTDNAWSAPADARNTHLFVVLRDARGGVAFSSQTLVTR